MMQPFAVNALMNVWIRKLAVENGDCTKLQSFILEVVFCTYDLSCE